MMTYTVFTISKYTWQRLHAKPFKANRDGTSDALETDPSDRLSVLQREHIQDGKLRISYEIGSKDNGPEYPIMMIEEWILDEITGLPKKSVAQ